jgi:transcriptional regulator of acetoin/glycerol metabolism
LFTEIVASWERCARAGLRPERFEVPYDADVDDRGRLCWAAGPVLDQVGGHLDGTGVGLLLTDQRARVLARRAADHDTAGLLDRVQLAPGFGYREEQIGTNAIGTAIAGRGPALVAGQEHFADALTRLACAAVTVTDPATGRVIGVVAVGCLCRAVDGTQNVQFGGAVADGETKPETRTSGGNVRLAQARPDHCG